MTARSVTCALVVLTSSVIRLYAVGCFWMCHPRPSLPLIECFGNFFGTLCIQFLDADMGSFVNLTT